MCRLLVLETGYLSNINHVDNYSPCTCQSRPAYATPKLLDKVGLSFSDIDVFEYHEAFAVSSSFPCREYCIVV